MALLPYSPHIHAPSVYLFYLISLNDLGYHAFILIGHHVIQALHLLHLLVPFSLKITLIGLFRNKYTFLGVSILSYNYYLPVDPLPLAEYILDAFDDPAVYYFFPFFIAAMSNYIPYYFLLKLLSLPHS